VVVQKGLAPGETVVTEGQLRLEQGTQVQLADADGNPQGGGRNGNGGRNGGRGGRGRRNGGEATGGSSSAGNGGAGNTSAPGGGASS